MTETNSKSSFTPLFMLVTKVPDTQIGQEAYSALKRKGVRSLEGIANVPQSELRAIMSSEAYAAIEPYSLKTSSKQINIPAVVENVPQVKELIVDKPKPCLPTNSHDPSITGLLSKMREAGYGIQLGAVITSEGIKSLDELVKKGPSYLLDKKVEEDEMEALQNILKIKYGINFVDPVVTHKANTGIVDEKEKESRESIRKAIEWLKKKPTAPPQSIFESMPKNLGLKKYGLKSNRTY